MEVHHHPHVEKKSFKEYLLEGLMIFVAVTMGFIAETIRESITEHERAKSYAELMVKDLKSDTTDLRRYSRYYTHLANGSDTLLQLLTDNEPKNIPSGKLYWYGLFGGGTQSFVTNDATLQQLKSSGSLRLFDKKIAYEISAYDRAVKILQSREQDYVPMFVEARKARAMIYDFKFLAEANTLNLEYNNPAKFRYSAVDSFMRTNPPLLDNDKIKFNQLAEMIRARNMHQFVTISDNLSKRAIELIKILQDAYRLEKE